MAAEGGLMEVDQASVERQGVDPLPDLDVPGLPPSALPPLETLTAPSQDVGAPAPPPLLRPAGFLRRALAFSMDFIVMQFLYLIVYIVGILGASRSTEWDRIVRAASSPALMAPFITVWFFLFIGYFSFFHAYGGQTPAKMLIRIKVVTRDGEGLSPLQSLCRTLAYFPSSLFFGFGFLLSIVERKKRGLHDLLTRSQVILD